MVGLNKSLTNGQAKTCAGGFRGVKGFENPLKM
jgi:hypothetical protein